MGFGFFSDGTASSFLTGSTGTVSAGGVAGVTGEIGFSSGGETGAAGISCEGFSTADLILSVSVGLETAGLAVSGTPGTGFGGTDGATGVGGTAGCGGVGGVTRSAGVSAAGLAGSSFLCTEDEGAA